VIIFHGAYYFAIVLIVLLMLGFYGRTKDRTLLTMGLIVLVPIVVDAYLRHLNWVAVTIALGVSISIGLSSRKR
jgi:hypothetical protein